MLKAIFEAYGNLEVIRVVDAAQPIPKSNQVLVKVKAAGLNPKDILVRKGKFKIFTGNSFPQGIGFECAGIVEESNSATFKCGDKVFGMINGWLGRCCAEYVAIDSNELTLAPNSLKHNELAGVALAGQTALQAMRDIGKLKKGQRLCINGASGGVGTLAIQIAKVLGAHVTTISSNRNTSFCKSLGSDETLAYDIQDVLDIDLKFDLFFDVFGNYSFGKIAHLLNKKGIYVTTVPKSDIFKQQVFNLVRSKKAKIVVVKSKAEDLRWLAEQLEHKKIKPILDRTFQLNKIKEAQAYIESKRAKGKVIVEFLR